MGESEALLLHLGCDAWPLAALQLAVFDDGEKQDLVSFSVPLTGTGNARHDERCKCVWSG